MEFFKNWGVIATFLTVVWCVMYFIMEFAVFLMDTVGYFWGAVIFGIIVSFLVAFFVTFIQELETEEEKED